MKQTFLKILLLSPLVSVLLISVSAKADPGAYSFKVLEDDENAKISGGGVLVDKLLHFMKATNTKPTELCSQELADLNSLQSELDTAKYGVSQGQVDIARDEISDQIDMTISACGKEVQEKCSSFKESNNTKLLAQCKSLPLKASKED